ncbi:WD40 repeat domain-containing protein [Herpetosiphon llansteffanensis]|uniref:WD40 repeat domain-containing protein n=1 Tax=Herpetosiphon llansteffanensis TaxID=2094568 RepID=UPI000D7CF378|nr:WD40 repeat domain-containing protein [Herpetosiphon llansteffanensis]
MITYHVQCGKWGYTPNPIAWHPQQALLASGSTLDYKKRHDVTIWNADGQLQTKLTCQSYVEELQWVLNGTMLAVRANTIQLWNHHGRLIHQIPGSRMAWNPVYPQVVSYIAKQNFWQLWDLARATIHRLGENPVPESFKDNLVWSVDGECLVAAWNQPTLNTIELRIWQRNGQLVTQTSIKPRQISQVLEIIWHPSSRMFAIRMQFTVLLIDRAGHMLDQWELDSDQREWEHGRCFGWSPDGALLAQANQTKLQIRNLNGQSISIELETTVMAFAWHPTGDFLTIAGWNNQIQCWDRHGKHLATVITDVAEVGARMIMIPFILEWDVSGSYLAASLRGCTIHLWRYDP